MLNRECPKCGQMEARVRHNRALEQMELECTLCKYEWILKPLDVLRADKEKQAAAQYKTRACRQCGNALPAHYSFSFCTACRDLGKMSFAHWSKDPLIPYAGCECSSCAEARTVVVGVSDGTAPVDGS